MVIDVAFHFFLSREVHMNETTLLTSVFEIESLTNNFECSILINNLIDTNNWFHGYNVLIP